MKKAAAARRQPDEFRGRKSAGVECEGASLLGLD